MMEIDIISFGKISSFISNQRMQLEHVQDTDQLSELLESSFPELASMKYKLALNKNLVQSNQELKNDDIIALMPPFSGG